MQFTILEPMSTGDVIDRAVRLYRRNFAPLIAIAAVPTLIGYVVSLMFYYGYANLVLNAGNTGRVPADAVLMLILGMIGYPIWGFVLLLTWCGASRVVGDNLMMGEPITFRRCFAVVRGKVGSVIVLGLLIIALGFGLNIVAGFAIFIILLIIGVAAGLITSMHLPQWAIVIAGVILVLLVIAVAMFVASFFFARVVFMPQVLMIEGESAGSSLSRAIKLGKGNWYRVLSIGLFVYFVSFSLLGALSEPVLIILYMTGNLDQNFFVGSGWNIFYTSFQNLASMLVLPIWMLSFTLLYFDSRVRKEAYDVELLAREVSPGYTWRAQAPAFAGYYPPRTYVQTGPLGLGGYYPPPPQPQPQVPATAGPVWPPGWPGAPPGGQAWPGAPPGGQGWSGAPLSGQAWPGAPPGGQGWQSPASGGGAQAWPGVPQGGQQWPGNPPPGGFPAPGPPGDPLSGPNLPQMSPGPGGASSDTDGGAPPPLDAEPGSAGTAMPESQANPPAAPAGTPSWCRVCGDGLQSTARFCSRCGTPVAPQGAETLGGTP